MNKWLLTPLSLLAACGSQHDDPKPARGTQVTIHCQIAAGSDEPSFATRIAGEVAGPDPERTPILFGVDLYAPSGAWGPYMFAVPRGCARGGLVVSSETGLRKLDWWHPAGHKIELAFSQHPDATVQGIGALTFASTGPMAGKRAEIDQRLCPAGSAAAASLLLLSGTVLAPTSEIVLASTAPLDPSSLVVRSSAGPVDTRAYVHEHDSSIRLAPKNAWPFGEKLSLDASAARDPIGRPFAFDGASFEVLATTDVATDLEFIKPPPAGASRGATVVMGKWTVKGSAGTGYAGLLALGEPPAGATRLELRNHRSCPDEGTFAIIAADGSVRRSSSHCYSDYTNDTVDIPGPGPLWLSVSAPAASGCPGDPEHDELSFYVDELVWK